MCGRYASTRSSADLAALFEAVDSTGDDWRADYNVAPTDPVPIIRRSGQASRTLDIARWGLVPHWSRDPSGAARMINARAETVATTRAFADAFAERRCLVPADGWYEWRRSDAAPGRKQPYFMTRRDGGVLAFGGLWSTWGAAGSRLLTFSIVTVAAVGALAAVHDRMPLLLEPAQWWSWLTAAQATSMLVAAAPSYLAGLELRPVSPAVGDVRNDGPQLIEPVLVDPVWSTVDDAQPTLF